MKWNLLKLMNNSYYKSGLALWQSVYHVTKAPWETESARWRVGPPTPWCPLQVGLSPACFLTHKVEDWALLPILTGWSCCLGKEWDPAWAQWDGVLGLISNVCYGGGLDIVHS